MKRELYNIIN